MKNKINTKDGKTKITIREIYGYTRNAYTAFGRLRCSLDNLKIALVNPEIFKYKKGKHSVALSIYIKSMEYEYEAITNSLCLFDLKMNLSTLEESVVIPKEFDASRKEFVIQLKGMIDQYQKMMEEYDSTISELKEKLVNTLDSNEINNKDGKTIITIREIYGYTQESYTAFGRLQSGLDSLHIALEHPDIFNDKKGRRYVSLYDYIRGMEYEVDIHPRDLYQLRSKLSILEESVVIPKMLDPSRKVLIIQLKGMIDQYQEMMKEYDSIISELKGELIKTAASEGNK